MQTRLLFLAFALGAVLTQSAFATSGEVDDPDGSTNLRAEASRASAIVATVKNREVVNFEDAYGTDWLKVTLASGKKGYMHSSRIRLHATMADPADAPANDEIHIFARRAGLELYPIARAAAGGDTTAMRQFFEFQSDGAAMETHDALYLAVVHLIGDRKLEQFLRQSSQAARADMRDRLKNNSALPFKTRPYLKRHFPKSAALLFR